MSQPIKALDHLKFKKKIIPHPVPLDITSAIVEGPNEIVVSSGSLLPYLGLIQLFSARSLDGPGGLIEGLRRHAVLTREEGRAHVQRHFDRQGEVKLVRHFCLLSRLSSSSLFPSRSSYRLIPALPLGPLQSHVLCIFVVILPNNIVFNITARGFHLHFGPALAHTNEVSCKGRPLFPRPTLRCVLLSQDERADAHMDVSGVLEQVEILGFGPG